MEEKKVLNEDLIFADFHIHSRFSRACSKDINLSNLVKWARIKGLGILGTGDFTHPIWIEELKNSLTEQNGIFYYKDEKGEFPFILTSEISLMYSQGGKGRKVHLVILAPNINAVEKINQWLDTRGRRDYDGRPIFGISCRDFAAKMQEIDEKIELIPAHAWTPYFGIFGSMSGFDSLKEAFLDKTDRIHAIETGISSDPAMNWKIKDLDDIAIVSFSDSHSLWPWRLGRESTIFYKIPSLSYDMILGQIRTNSFYGTVEADPSYGKYHFDGHADCGFSSSPIETAKLNGICPKCNKKLTIGVDNRVEELAKRENSNHKIKKQYYTILPLHELISLSIGIGMASKGAWKVYDNLIENFGNEFNILLNVSKKDLINVLKDGLLVDLIIKNREGQIKIKPGYDGIYGEALLSEKQKTLF
jgi:uncharacterized protein (TIGR00375 family)